MVDVSTKAVLRICIHKNLSLLHRFVIEINLPLWIGPAKLSNRIFHQIVIRSITKSISVYFSSSLVLRQVWYFG